MRILMISWEYPPHMVGGVGKHVAELVPALSAVATDAPSFHLDLLTIRSAGGAEREEISPHVTIHRVETPPIDPHDLFNSVVESGRLLESRAHEMAQVRSYDLIHVHDWLVASTGIALKHDWKAPLVATVHATERGRHRSYLPNEMSRQINQLEWQVCFEAWRIIVCSGYMAGELQGYFDTPPDKMSIVPNGIDPVPMQRCPPLEVKRIRERYTPNGEKLLFFVGRITPEKGLQILLRAMPLVLDGGRNLRLLVAGKNSEQMQPLVDELRISHAVEILGFISNQTRNCLYNAVDAAVFPSLYEPFGIVALEAMAANCNVIVSDVGGLSEVVHHMHNGLTVLTNNPQSIAWAINQLFADPARAEAMRRVALEQVVSLYDWPSIAQRTLSLYRAIWERRQETTW